MPDATPVRSILVATDLSAQEDIAVQRTAQLAHAHGASIRLVYMPPRGQEPATDAATRLAKAARHLEDGLGVRVATLNAKAHKLEDLFAPSRGMDLVVLPNRRERSTGAFFRGQPVLRLLRTARCPVLVVRSASLAPYRRVLVGVDFGKESHALAQLAATFDKEARLELFHAVETKTESRLRFAEATEAAVREYRHRCLQHARRRMVDLARLVEAGNDRLVATTFGRGDAGHQVVQQQQHSGADLVVVGKRRSSAWEDFFCGSVAHRVLSWGSSDVLVVPLGAAAATAPVAARRLATECVS